MAGDPLEAFVLHPPLAGHLPVHFVIPETERLSITHDMSCRRQREMSGAYGDVRLAVPVQEASARVAGDFHVVIRAGGPFGVEALDRAVHQVAAHHGIRELTPDMDLGLRV